MLTLQAADEARQMWIGGRLVAACPANFVIYLAGDLGAGKTALVRGMLRGLGYQGAVKSPTYTLMEPYQVAGRTICHFDLYRLGDPEELEYLGLRDLLAQETLLLFEWPERGSGMLPAADLLVEIHHLAQGRRLELAACSPDGHQTLLHLSHDIDRIYDE